MPGLRNPNALRQAHPDLVGTYLKVLTICLNLPERGLSVNVPVTLIASSNCKKLPKGADIKINYFSSNSLYLRAI